MIWIILIFALFGVVCYTVSPYILFWRAYKPLNGDYKKWWEAATAFFKARAEMKLFMFVVSAEAGVAGVLPQLLRFAYKDFERDIFLEIGDNSDWLSLCIAIIIAILYYLHLSRQPVTMPKGWENIEDAANLIHSHLGTSLSPKWFSDQNDKGIRELGRKYSEEKNFPYDEMPWLLAALRNEDAFSSSSTNVF